MDTVKKISRPEAKAQRYTTWFNPLRRWASEKRCSADILNETKLIDIISRDA